MLSNASTTAWLLELHSQQLLMAPKQQPDGQGLEPCCCIELDIPGAIAPGTRGSGPLRSLSCSCGSTGAAAAQQGHSSQCSLFATAHAHSSVQQSSARNTCSTTQAQTIPVAGGALVVSTASPVQRSRMLLLQVPSKTQCSLLHCSANHVTDKGGQG